MTNDAEATVPRTVIPWLVTILVAVVAMVAFGSALTGAEPAAAQTAPAERVATDWTRVTAGGAFTCGLRSSGRIFCWGNDSVGQLGNGTGGSTDYPTELAGHRTDWVALDAGDNSACALRQSGRLFCWGYDQYGQIGDGGGFETRQVPTAVAGGRTDWSPAFSVGAGHVCARRTNGRLFCWGADGQSQLGNGDATGNRPAPVPVAGGITDWASVSAGGLHTCARRVGGRLYCWGDDDYGQLGSGNVNGDRPQPTEVVGARTDWTGPVSAGGYHTCARRTNGSEFCWGTDGFGQLGNGFPAGSSTTPIEPVGPPDSTTQVAAGLNHTCAVTRTGHLYCTGNNVSGQLGSGDPGGPSSIFVEVLGLRTDWRSVSTGAGHSCALTVDHRLWCWGENGSGQLGTPGANRFTPLQVTFPDF